MKVLSLAILSAVGEIAASSDSMVVLHCAVMSAGTTWQATLSPGYPWLVEMLKPRVPTALAGLAGNTPVTKATAASALSSRRSNIGLPSSVLFSPEPDGDAQHPARARS